MIKMLKALIGKKSIKNKAMQNQEASDEKSIDEYFEDQVNASVYIREDCRDVVLEHLKGELDLLKTANLLDVDEKKLLGLNARQSLTKEFVEILTSDGLKLQNPKAILSNMWSGATIIKSRHDNHAKAVESGVKKFTLHASGDKSECEWCKEHLEVEMGSEILRLMDENCTCEPYSKCFINIVVEFNTD